MADRVLILGAAGRDFHNFNVYFRDNDRFEVVAFTATQIPNIEGRRYPPELAGARYPKGIPIEAEAEMARIIREEEIDVVVFGYSDVSNDHVMRLASMALAEGPNFLILGPEDTMVPSTKPVVAVCAARTGCGKSQTSRRVAEILSANGKRVVVTRHPMPYGDLAKQAVQRFGSYEDLAEHNVTIEEREEYEPHIDAGRVVFAGIDYERILREVEKEADVVVFDGGNNDMPFFKPDVTVTVVDPHRADHARRYFPGQTNVRMADAIVMNKVETADYEGLETCRRVAVELNPDAIFIEAASPLFVENGELIRGKKVIVVEDGPTLTHGEMAYGGGWIAARRYGAAEIIDPRPYAVGSIADTYASYPTTGNVLPAMGYDETMRAELRETIARSDAEVVVIATPIDLMRVIDIEKPALRVRYELQEIGRPTLEDVLRPLTG